MLSLNTILRLEDKARMYLANFQTATCTKATERLAARTRILALEKTFLQRSKALPKGEAEILLDMLHQELEETFNTFEMVLQLRSEAIECERFRASANIM